MVAVINLSSNNVIGYVNIESGDASGARDILVRPDNAFVFVANTAKQSVSVFDTSSNPAVAQIDTPGHPRRLAITPQGPVGPYLVFATVWEGWVTVIESSGNTNTWLMNISVGNEDSHTRGIAITPDNSVRNETYVTNSGDGTVRIIDNNTWNVDTLHGFFSPWHVAITPDGHYACVSNLDADTVTIIDTSDPNHSVAATRDVGHGPFFSVSDPDSEHLWVSNADEHTSAGSVSGH